MKRETGKIDRKVRTVWRECRIGMIALILLLLPFALTPPPCAYSAGKWPGVDESVVEKYAREHGRESREPLINTDQGDLLLFVFLLAGSLGGFLAGYSWRKLVVEKAPETKKLAQECKA